MFKKARLELYGFLIIVLLLALLPMVSNFTSAHAATTMTITSQDALTTPWLGLGAQYGNIETSLTDSQWNTLFGEVNYMQPGIVRSTDNFGMCTSSGCPSYDWNAPSMQSWYRMLDALKNSGTIVMIGAWRVPDGVDFASTQFAQIEADFLKYMIVTKGYTNILYYHTPNEADCDYTGQDWTNKTLSQWETATNNLYAALSNEGLLGQVAIAGPDACGDGWNSQAPTDEQSHLGLYEWHHYDGNVSNGNDEAYLRKQRQTVDNTTTPLPVFLGEIGAGDPDYNGATNAYQYGLDMADYGVQVARAGLSGASAWCLDDNFFSPKACGMGNVVTNTLKPWFYSWSLLTRYIRPGSTIYVPADSISGLRVVAAQSASLVSNLLYWTVVFVNQNSANQTLSVNIPGTGSIKFDQYNYVDGQRSVNSNGFPTPATTIQGALGTDINVTVPAKSMVLLTNLASSGTLNSILNIATPQATATDTNTGGNTPGVTPTPTPTSASTGSVPTTSTTPTPTPTSASTGSVPANSTTPTPTPTSISSTPVTSATPTPTPTPNSGQTTVVDDLNDWSKVASHTSALTFDTIHDSWFENDTSRVKRWGNIPQNFVYHYQNIVNFQARVYLSNPNRVSSFSVDTSPDGMNWTPVALQYTAISKVFDKKTDLFGIIDISNVYATTYTPVDAIPAGTQYIRINLANDPLMWTPQVGQVTLTVGNAASTV